jgi:hypothetical protein
MRKPSETGHERRIDLPASVSKTVSKTARKTTGKSTAENLF